MDKIYALIIRPGEVFGFYAIQLREVTREHDVFFKERVVDSLEGLPSAELRRLVACCRWTLPETLYNKGGRSFPSPRVFFQNAEKSTVKYLAQQVGKHLMEAFALARSLGISIWKDTLPGDPLEERKRLTFVDDPMPAHLKFTKTDDGIDYRLTLANGLVPMEHKVEVLSDKPPIFIIDREIRTFGEGTNGLVLKPFCSKEIIHIPQAHQSKYFRTFVLRMAYHNDIEAVGFEMRELHPEPVAHLLLEQNVGGEYGLSTEFVYDDKRFKPDNRREKSIILHDDGEQVDFVCIYRDRNAERLLTQWLDEELHMPKNGPLKEMAAWIAEHLDVLRQRGVVVDQYGTRRYYIGDVHITQSTKALGDWFHIHVELHFDNGMTVPMSALKDALCQGDTEFLLPNGEWFVIPEGWFARYGALVLFGRRSTSGGISIHRYQRAMFPELDGGKRQSTLPAMDKTPPQDFHAQLRPYQEAGYEWLVTHMMEGAGCILGDDMGLGKTVQTIALMTKYHESTSGGGGATRTDGQLSLFDNNDGDVADDKTAAPKRFPMLVVAPASVVYNWRNELRRFAPAMHVLTYVGTPSERKEKAKYIANSDVVVTTYQTLRIDIDTLNRYHYAIAVFDEAQSFKNSSSLLYAAIRRVSTDFPLALSGTPIENSLEELWAIMNIVNSNLLGDRNTFVKQFLHPITANLMSTKTKLLKQLVAPFFLRRRKEDVLDNLPERQDETILCEMTPQQAERYEAEESSMRNLIFDNTRKLDNVHVLTAIGRLRQMACSPDLVSPPPGTVAPDGPSGLEGSGKMQALFEHLEQLRGTTHKALLFSDYARFLDLIADEMDRRKWKYTMLTGSTANREQVIAGFQEDAECQFFLITLKAGGVGLNLTEADYVFLLDPWWNMAAEEQAISRAHRMGQRRAVFVYRMITSGTLEEEIQHVQNHKQSVIDAVLSLENNKN